MALGDLHKLSLESITSGGDALGRIKGKPVFVETGAPGDTVLCRIIEEHKTWEKAQILEIIDASPARTESKCRYYGKCGGCNLQHIDYSAQLEIKKTVLKENFTRIGGFSDIELAIIPGNAWEYRNRMQFHCFRQHNRGEKNHDFGLKGRDNQEIIAVRDCLIADPGIRNMLQYGKNIPIPPDKDRFTVYARNGLLLNEGSKKRGQISLLGKELTIDTGVFFQSNGVMLEKLILDLQELACGMSGNMADIFCGAGTFACFTGERFEKIDLVEEDKTSLSLARENLRGLNAEFFVFRDSDFSAELVKRKKTYDFIIVDPPRKGLSSRLVSALVKKGPPVLVYVSCDPASLARDAKLLCRGRYSLRGLAFYDFYPQTSHIESLAVFNY
ncbi:MAG: methyltransferase [Treponema sp.]|jgi:23S rRNA (uracil1939-C5)-methyltransferase|nr:methyltransferase [Treponema sp.]